MFALGLNVTAMIRVSNQKGLQNFKQLIIIARSIFLLTVILETVFGITFILLHNYLPHLFLNTDNSAQIIDNKEVILIASKLLIVAAFFKFQMAYKW